MGQLGKAGRSLIGRGSLVRGVAAGLIGLGLVAGVLAGGCVSSRTFVLQPVAPGVTLGRVVVRAGESPVRVDDAARMDFEAKLAAQLRGKVGAEVGQPADLVIEYRFVLFDQGSGPLRVGSGLAALAGSPIYGIGDGAVGVEVVYLRPSGERVGHIVSDGPIAGAFASTGGALDTAAGAVADYTKANFTCPVCGRVGEVREEPQDVSGFKKMK